ncbi:MULTISPECIES: hypothetical protein [unclassified Anabaena]|uniref:hypothetical protein n=1 Tax=unclassified Anabaena TaxID=2619674 RepID=UPI001447B75A|nr:MULTISPECIES: hypothetical protein [unclassified Anabaena]MTJ06840.1 hypothetical protein [Anabaena sp. UHCC 0204]MTJ54920.1 hypothetical protein [Anabaena sp. UHCC 0253]
MAAIMNTELSSVEVNRLFHKLTLEEMESTSGGNMVIPLWSSNYKIIDDGLNSLNSLIGTYLTPFGFYDNKILTIDFSDTDVYLIV